MYTYLPIRTYGRLQDTVDGLTRPIDSSIPSPPPPRTHKTRAQASRILAAKGASTAPSTSADEAPLLQAHHHGDGTSSGDTNTRNEAIYATRLLVKALRALEAPEGGGSGAHALGAPALLAALEAAVERRVGELPPGYLAAEEGLVKGAWDCLHLDGVGWSVLCAPSIQLRLHPPSNIPTRPHPNNTHRTDRPGAQPRAARGAGGHQCLLGRGLRAAPADAPQARGRDPAVVPVGGEGAGCVRGWGGRRRVCFRVRVSCAGWRGMAVWMADGSTHTCMCISRHRVGDRGGRQRQAGGARGAAARHRGRRRDGRAQGGHVPAGVQDHAGACARGLTPGRTHQIDRPPKLQSHPSLLYHADSTMHPHTAPPPTNRSAARASGRTSSSRS